jgi:hypothetical protein
LSLKEASGGIATLMRMDAYKMISILMIFQILHNGLLIMDIKSRSYERD